MFADYLKDPQLAKRVRTLYNGEELFLAGEQASTLYLIIQGNVVLQSPGTPPKRVGTVGPGEMIGEKAILEETPYRHRHDGIAQGEVTLLELDHRSIRTVLTKIPDFIFKVLRRVIERLDQANELIAVLQVPDETERLISYLTYFCRYHHKKAIQGLEISVTAKEIHLATALNEGLIERSLAFLVSQKVLVKKKNSFLLTDEYALNASLPMLKEREAA